MNLNQETHTNWLPIRLLLFVAIGSVSGCGLVKAIDYSFYVPEHVEFVVGQKCYGIENQPLERLLITDCGGYLNVMVSTLTIGLAKSGGSTTLRYRRAAETYLRSKYENCSITDYRDHGGRIFEIFYNCQPANNINRLPSIKN